MLRYTIKRGGGDHKDNLIDQLGIQIKDSNVFNGIPAFDYWGSAENYPNWCYAGS